MDTLDIIKKIKAIEIDSPVDKIIRQLKQLIVSGQLKAGDKLPPERLLAERFGVGRGYIREALYKLEFYGLLKTSPQSGTYVAGFSIQILDRIFTDVINFNKDDLASMIEGRFYLETSAARLAAERRTEEDIIEMQKVLASFDSKVSNDDIAVEEDMLFHIRIAKATCNPVIESMLIILIPDLIRNIVEKNLCEGRRNEKSINEHHTILNAIIERDAEAAGDAMAYHLSEIMGRRYSL